MPVEIIGGKLFIQLCPRGRRRCSFQRDLRESGNANDDGYINTQDGQLATSTATDPQAFKDQYYMKLQNPNNYTIPRRSRIGVSVNF